jgi:glycogen synthase
VKVLYWIQQFWPYIGGIEVQASQFLPAMKTRGHEFAVVTDTGPMNLADEDKYKDIPIYRFPFHEALATKNVNLIGDILQRVRSLKQAFEPDVIHLNISDPSFFFELHTRGGNRTPVCVSFRNSLSNLIQGTSPNTLLKRLLDTADRITGNSQFVLQQIRSLTPSSEGKLSLAYGIDVPCITPSPLSFDQPELLCFGRVVKEKGFDTAIAAFASIAQNFPSLKLTVAGNGPERAHLECLVNDLSLGERVTFRGWVVPEEIPNVLNQSTVVLVPSRWDEAFGQVAVLAGYMARPVIASDSGGLPEIILHEETGLIVERDDVDAFARAIRFLLENPHRATEMGELARIHTTQMFNLEQLLNTHDQLYKQLKNRGVCSV